MNKQLEVENNDGTYILEGEYQENPQQQRIFKDLEKALDYIRTFNIQNCNIESGYLNSERVVAVTYWRIE